jgi:hypothetical protein
MTNVPTDRTDELQEQNAVEQPVETPTSVEVQAEESQKSPQTENSEVGVKTESAEATEVSEEKETVSKVELSVEEAEIPISKEESATEGEISTLKDEDATPVSKVEEAVAETETTAIPVSESEEKETAEGKASEETQTEDVEPNFEEDTSKEITVPDTKEGIIERLNTLAEHPEQSEKQELDLLKVNFYKILKEEKTQAFNQFCEAGGKVEEFIQQQDPLEETFKEKMSIIKEHRAELQEAAEHQKEVNLEKKKAIIEQIKDLAKTPEEANKNYERFRKLQEEWKEIKPIPSQSSNEVWKNFQFSVEQYYDLLKENNALRDYDFKKNLESKSLLCEAAEKLVDDPDIINASHQLQQLHQEFREIGPVAKDLREDLWNRFKTASTAINKRHAQYFEQLKEKEDENLQLKTALCEEIESIETSNLQSFSDWDAITKKIIEIQQRWKEIGRAPKKLNTTIFERFRAACDNFFNQKAEHFKEQKKEYAENAGKKIALCEQAEALKESTEWNATTNKLVQLQKDWKEIGLVSRKVSNTLWERFNSACNYFFEQKKKTLGDQRKEETANLTKKMTIIDKLEAIAVEGGQEAAEKVRTLMDEWSETGHVPFKDKDKVYAKYHDVIDRLFKELNLNSIRRGGGRPRRNNERNNQNESNNHSHANSLYRIYETKKAELATYENNISFITSHSKTGNTLIDAMNKKIDALKTELESLVDRIKAQEHVGEESEIKSDGPSVTDVHSKESEPEKSESVPPKEEKE